MTQPSHTAFITGASSGIGAIYAERLAARGYNLILAARREDRLQALADQLQARYAIQASILKADLSEEHGIAAVEQRLQQDPAIDLFINNAGTAKLAGFLASTPREHQAIHTLNTTALLRLSYAALAAFTPRRRGTLIKYCLYPRAAYAAGQRSLQRQQSLGVELHPRPAGGVCRQRRAYSGGIAGGDRYRSVADLRRGAGRSAQRHGNDHRGSG
ncbi:Probable short-chain dehydrogenase [Klebsiella pneumoniae IS46]|nr:Probable short-chain dehydrogenase [Klebsiella pneumoniae IS46]